MRSRQAATISRGRHAYPGDAWLVGDAGCHTRQRTKEDADDYRYFPEPDLPTLVLTDAFIAEAGASLPELPEARRTRYMTVFNLSPQDARILTESPEMGNYFEAILGENPSPERVRTAAALVTNDLRTLMNERDISLTQAPAPEAVRQLIDLIERGVISRTAAKEVFAEMVASGTDATTIVTERGLAQQNDEAALREYVERAIAENSRAVADYRSGKQGALNFLAGAVMKMSKGTANIQVVREMLEQRLAAPE